PGHTGEGDNDGHNDDDDGGLPDPTGGLPDPVGNLFGDFSFGSSNFNLLLANELLGGSHETHNRHRVKKYPLPPQLRTVYYYQQPLFIAKCLVGSPLKNLADGLDIYCGPGFGHQECPMASQCIMGPNGEYYACCQVP